MSNTSPDTPKTVLYIEDDEDNREMISVFLGTKGYEVTTAKSAEEGLQMAKENGYTAILMDNWLPDMPGPDLCQRIRMYNRRTPILFYTGAARESEREEALQAGAQRYLIKPDDLLTIPDVLEQLT